MPLDPQVSALLADFEAQGLPSLSEMNVPQARAVAAGYPAMQGEPQPVGEVRDLEIPGPAGQLPIRVYLPDTPMPRPVLLFFHGGGWVFGNIEIVDRPCRALANAIGCTVVSVEFRLSPETKFPGPLDDCYAATQWVADHAAWLGGEPDRIGVAGDSGGGNLAAAVAQMARDRGGPTLAYQLLIYPVLAPERNSPYQSYHDCADGFLLTRDAMKWFWGHYLDNPEQEGDPYAAPLNATDLSGLPPAGIVTCEFDPLRDEALAYATKLREDGVPVRVFPQAGMIHGFFWLGGVLDRMNEVLPGLAEEVRAGFEAGRGGLNRHMPSPCLARRSPEVQLRLNRRA